METNKEQDKTLLRAEFEAWHLKRFGYKAVLIPEMGNSYKNHTSRVAWEAWQAALSQPCAAMNVNYTAADCGCAPNEAAGEQVQEIKRYEMAVRYGKYACEDVADPVEADDGDWVRYSDVCAVLAAQPTPAQGDAVPDGWQLVPKVPTEDMLSAPNYLSLPWANECYQSMLAAAPQPANATRQSSADAVDAARYRELRKDSQMYYVAYRNEGMGWAFSQINMDKLDKYIDAAIAAQGGKGE